ncbi:hypothetical protein [Isoptericola cucumis]|uniref:hypothetical protein n=1 Tax=Isoptericola cucumis TaxID=1776856 RepID=UPI0016693874|nr:hypothetical protein [Isoptericola cucumis]
MASRPLHEPAFLILSALAARVRHTGTGSRAHEAERLGTCSTAPSPARGPVAARPDVPAARVLGSLTWTLSLGDVGIRTWVGWTVGQSVLAVAVAQRASVSSLGGAAARPRARGKVAALGAALPVLTMAQGLLGIQPWFTGTGMIVLSHVATGGLLATVGVLGCVAVALGLGRIGHVVASLAQLDVVDPADGWSSAVGGPTTA